MDKIKPLPCKCGAEARVRYKEPCTWVECKRKCGMRTGWYYDWYNRQDPDSEKEAIEAWNRMVKKDG